MGIVMFWERWWNDLGEKWWNERLYEITVFSQVYFVIVTFCFFLTFRTFESFFAFLRREMNFSSYSNAKHSLVIRFQKRLSICSFYAVLKKLKFSKQYEVNNNYSWSMNCYIIVFQYCALYK